MKKHSNCFQIYIIDTLRYFPQCHKGKWIHLLDGYHLTSSLNSGFESTKDMKFEMMPSKVPEVTTLGACRKI